ncbi:protein NDNF isoform X3 [Glossina fuscipes]|nr:protein NDNF isoform X3 [Glossina fuscipes]XP_037898196.1 protein NDNF isoform X3 [Glossina fuscipes]XP_037898197.1 protein NDNF isoform X3 [Glossina fuscipes]XP_037898198.1 protein NDNF isoform X3 [Glossina fuscipes]XP_037898199.1 protein NDNF isoform X3 [Glossina fuscipes]XP_037898200.1 protein NDNF isoform X3 [Glossina fuscipes]XP_037898202.1 protein NDNF isoform X3 [Glossina fuscipes]XP_037898203.1 protein NDNF isoform X3 [Glossina fuscipes]XP_037898204.1 protein NDNF isoform X3 [Glo
MSLNSETKLHLNSLYVRPAHISWHTLLLGCYWVLFTCYMSQATLQLEVFRISDSSYPSLNHFNDTQCSSRKFDSLAKVIDDVESLELDVPVNIAFDNRQRKRFVLQLNTSTPLNINFSQIVARKLYFNKSANLIRSSKANQRTLILHCALKGQYDLFVQARHRGSIKIEAHAWRSGDQWILLNRTQCVNIRTQNRVRKRQMIVKWNKSKFDFHAVQYCLVVSTRHAHKDLCAAIDEYVSGGYDKNPRSCAFFNILDLVFGKQAEKSRKIDPHITNVICTGSRTQQVIRGLAINYIYYLDVFGVHTKRENLTFHLSSSSVYFNRTQPTALKTHALNIVKISGLHGIQVFSYKIPSAKDAAKVTLRYLILPCGGTEVDAKIVKQRSIIGNEKNIYKATYIDVPSVSDGERYMIRFKPSNDDEVLRANKIALAVTTDIVFNQFPELPENTTIFEVRTQCRSTEIAWYSSPELRGIQYCIIVFNLPQRNRSSFDYTNYCMDFGKRVTEHPQFHSKKCPKKEKISSLMETDAIFNLLPGETYLIYVTVNLIDGKPLPYQSLKVKMYQHCPNE